MAKSLAKSSAKSLAKSAEDSPAKEPLLRSVERLMLRVDNVTAAARFYTETMGLTVDRQTASAAALKFPDGSAEIVLHDDRQRPDVEVVLGVADVRRLYDDRDALGLTFLTAPKPGGRGHRATIRDPFGHVLAIADRGEAAPAREDRPFDDALFEDAPPLDPADDTASDRAALVAVYEKIGRTADDLPYTPHFERLHSTYVRALAGVKPDHARVWRELLTLRKAGKLPKLGVAVSRPPPLDAADKQRLLTILGPDVGKRDRLPYTERFDAIVAEFNTGFARAFSPHVVWRLVATLAK